ncbi:MAG: hypothetical protein V1878_02105 [bacterium]
MKSKALFSRWLTIGVGILFLSSFVSYASGVEEAPSPSQIKVAVLEKMSQGQSAHRFGYLYPSLTENIRRALSQDGRFELISQEEVHQALGNLRIGKEKLNTDGLEQVAEIGRQAGADLVLITYLYEMSCHGGPMRSRNVLSLVRVQDQRMETVQKSCHQELSAQELASSDQVALQELLTKAKWLLKGR